MADYFPLISRAVANMGDSTAEDRRALYERAKLALVSQLRNSDPPIAETDIAREQIALEEAIRRVETEAAGGLPLEDALADFIEPMPPPSGAIEADIPAPPPPPTGTGERPRPPAPRLPTDRRRWVVFALIGVAIATVVGLTAVAAIMLKHKPSEFATVQRPATGDQERKFQDRLSGEGPAVTAEAPGSRADGAPGAGTSPAIPVLQRAILVEEASEGSQEVRQSVGKVLWRLDSVAVGPGQPVDAAIRAEVDLADAGLRADILIRRNRDTALPASHTIELRFAATERSANGKVRDIAVPEMRTEETQRGTPLLGLAVPVTENLFLIGLSSLPADIARNMDLLRQRNWLMMPIRFANNKRALLLFEKGTAGDRAVAEAMQSWQSQP